MIKCTVCKNEKDQSQFGLRKNSTRTYFQCTSCKTKIAALWNKENAIRRLSTHARARAKKLGIQCEIDFSWVMSVLQTRCPCCTDKYIMGHPQGRGRIRELRPSLDRFDPAIGYTKTNTRIICFRCNRTKNAGSASLHQNIANWIERGGPQYCELGFLNGDGI
jgi:hypothetical protein